MSRPFIRWRANPQRFRKSSWESFEPRPKVLIASAIPTPTTCGNHVLVPSAIAQEMSPRIRELQAWRLPRAHRARKLRERRRGCGYPPKFGLEATVRTKVKRISLGVCFVFLFVVIGGGLHLSPGGAFLAAATGTPLLIHMLNRQRTEGSGEPGPRSHQEAAAVHRVAEGQANHPGAFDSEDVVRR